MALLLVFAVSLSYATPAFATSSELSAEDSVYSFSADTTLYSLASSTGISPLSTTTPTYWSATDITNLLNAVGAGSGSKTGLYLLTDNIYSQVRNINSALYYNSTSLAYLAEQIRRSLDLTVQGSIAYNLSNMNTLFGRVYHADASNYGSIRVSNGWQPLNVNVSGGTLTSTVDLSPITNMLGFPSDTSLFSGPYYSIDYSGNLVTQNFVGAMQALVLYLSMRNSGGFLSLDVSGNTKTFYGLSLTEVANAGLTGLGAILRGQSGSVITGNLLSSSDLAETEFSANNILSMLSPLLNIQNDLARVTNVVADPEDQALNEANKENKQEIVDSFGSDGAGVGKSDISDMAGISSGFSSVLDTGVGVGDLFTDINDSSRYAFFTQETASQLDTTVSVLSDDEDDDFIEFYDPEHKEFWALMGVDKP